MSLEDTLRRADHFPMSAGAEDYVTPEPAVEPNWRWLELWEMENPSPHELGVPEDFDKWWAEYQLMSSRVWVAACLPNARVFDWTNGDVRAARRLVARHVCSVCGRVDDPGCWSGC